MITFLVLLFLNIYTSKVNQRLFYESKEVAMLDKAQLAAAAIADLEVLNPGTAASVITQMDSLRVARLVITDQRGLCMFDSANEHNSTQRYMLFPEIVKALQGNKVFFWKFEDAVIQSYAALPVYSYGNLIGSVYMMEYDLELGELMDSLLKNTLTISIVLQVILVLFSILFVKTFAHRLNRIMDSIRIIRTGDYSHKVKMGGKDELTELGDEFNDLTEKLQESERIHRRFISDASHELKTPLASIKLLSDSILQNEMDEITMREFVEDIGDEAERLNRMTQKLLSLAKTDDRDPSMIELNQIAPTATRVIKMLSPIASKASVTVDLQILQDSTILICEDDLYQILYNLTENAIKYNIAGGNVKVILDRQEDDAVITVSDSGMGIPEESIPHLFDRFYRVDKARSRATGGSGLGLSIVRSMVLRYDGDITVESVLEKGSTFSLRFPAFDTEEDML